MTQDPEEAASAAPETAPSELRRTAEGAGLVAVWPDGNRISFAAATLRNACRCAECTARRAAGEPLAQPAEIAISALTPIGGYAVNIVFSDGHRRGIFPWSLLRRLAAQPMSPRQS
ncbi:MAG TPA: DUF971 domain-containing protein [Stellaceae bacterium]|jgi:DUF971 family protein|nr:DUF971 domain-containing protein [Stellaceae bacterium]